jgi:hypothetical protein
VFTMRVPYAERRKAEQIAILSSIVLLLLVVTQVHKSSVLTVYVSMLWVYNVAAVINYRHERVYILNEGSSTYSFVVGPKSYTGQYNNVYVRLRKVSDDAARAPRKGDGSELPRYELVLNGLYIDQVSLSGRPSTEVKILRKCVGRDEALSVCCTARRLPISLDGADSDRSLPRTSTSTTSMRPTVSPCVAAGHAPRFLKTDHCWPERSICFP